MTLQAIIRSNFLVRFAFTAILLLTPAAVSAQERIVFQSQRDGNPEVYVMNSVGTNQVRLTFNSVFDGDATFSPGGEKIAFMSTRDGGNGEIYIMHADGSSQTRLTNSPGADFLPTFSPDGSKIVFASERNAHLGIWVMNVDGSNPTELVDGIGGTDPDYSPDGTKIIFSGNGGSGGDTEIWIMNADGTGRNNLTQDVNSRDGSPAFNADGTKIVYVREPHGPGAATTEIYEMNVDGTNKHALTNTNGLDFEPSYSVDGSRIVFTSLRVGTSEIYSMNPDGTDPINLTNHSGTDLAAAWGAANYAPVLSNVAVSTPITEGGVATLSGTIADANAGDSFVFDITWGDRQSQTVDYPAGTPSFAVTHVYADDPAVGADEFVINYTINDHRFGSDGGSKSVTVQNVNPTVSNLNVSPSPVSVGGTVTLTGDYSDPGFHGSPADEQLQVSVAWGDGQSTSVVASGAPGAINETHSYAVAGSYTIAVQVSDNDGGVTVATRSLDVVATPPSTPTNFRVQSVAAKRVDLAWTDAANNEDGFAIERCSGGKRACTFVEVARVGSNVNSYADTTVSAGEQYSYRMRSFNSGGTSSYTSVVTAKTPRK